MSGTTTVFPSDGRQRTLPIGLLVLLGGILGLSTVQFLITHPDQSVLWRMELLVTVGVTGSIIYAGYALFTGHYTMTDLWKILGLTAVGVVGAVALGSTIYAHQQLEQVSLAEPTFLLEFLALIGAGVGLASGIARWSMFERTSESQTDSSTAIDPDFWNLLSLLWSESEGLPNSDSETLRQRWTMIESLADTSTKELPITAFIIQLADDRVPAFPENNDETKSLVYDEHLPVLLENGLVEIDDEIGTIRYVGPDSITEHVTIRE